MIRYIIAFFFIPLAVFADDVVVYGNDALSVITYNSASDLSLRYLKAVFGSGIGVNVAGSLRSSKKNSHVQFLS